MCWRRAVLVWCALWAMSTGHAHMTEYIIPPEEPIFTQWHSEPREIGVLTEAPGRVLALQQVWTGGFQGVAVYFRGEATTLSRLLETFESQHRSRDYAAFVEIQDGALPDLKTLSEYDWVVCVGSQRQFGGPDHGKLLKVDVRIRIRVSPRLPLDQLQIPATLRVEADGRVEEFARKHEAQRLGGEVPMLKERIRKLQEALARLERRIAATQPATQPASR